MKGNGEREGKRRGKGREEGRRNGERGRVEKRRERWQEKKKGGMMKGKRGNNIVLIKNTCLVQRPGRLVPLHNSVTERIKLSTHFLSRD